MLVCSQTSFLRIPFLKNQCKSQLHPSPSHLPMQPMAIGHGSTIQSIQHNNGLYPASHWLLLLCPTCHLLGQVCKDWEEGPSVNRDQWTDLGLLETATQPRKNSQKGTRRVLRQYLSHFGTMRKYPHFPAVDQLDIYKSNQSILQTSKKQHSTWFCFPVLHEVVLTS